MPRFIIWLSPMKKNRATEPSSKHLEPMTLERRKSDAVGIKNGWNIGLREGQHHLKPLATYLKVKGTYHSEQEEFYG